MSLLVVAGRELVLDAVRASVGVDSAHMPCVTSRLRLCVRAWRAQAAKSHLEPLFSDVWLGTELWPAARALTDTLEQHRRAELASATLVLELGAGTGACGLAASLLGARSVLLTDMPSLLPTLRANAAANGLLVDEDSDPLTREERPMGEEERRVRCEALSWSCDALPSDTLPFGADLILAADCLNPVRSRHRPR